MRFVPVTGSAGSGGREGERQQVEGLLLHASTGGQVCPLPSMFLPWLSRCSRNATCASQLLVIGNSTRSAGMQLLPFPCVKTSSEASCFYKDTVKIDLPQM